MTHILKIKVLLKVVLIFAITSQASAAPPELQASGPIIYLADNLGEKDKLGWCLDTVGNGLSEVLHARACSADEDSGVRDFSFSFNDQSGQIKSESFEGKCATINVEGSQNAFGLIDCDFANKAQQFSYNAEQLSFHPSGREDVCLIAAAKAMDHGRFESRATSFAVCTEVDQTLRQWVIKVQ